MDKWRTKRLETEAEKDTYQNEGEAKEKKKGEKKPEKGDMIRGGEMNKETRTH